MEDFDAMGREKKQFGAAKQKTDAQDPGALFPVELGKDGETSNLGAPGLPDMIPENPAEGETYSDSQRLTAPEWLQEKFPGQDMALILPYYIKRHDPEYYTCIENSGWSRGVEAALNDEHVTDYVQRAIDNGLEEYIWHSAMDEGVCARCAENDGKRFRYKVTPPGGHPGMAAGCRCWAEPMAKSVRPQKSKTKSGGCLMLALQLLCVAALVVCVLVL